MIPNKVTSEGTFYCKLFTVKNWRESNATQLEINWKSPIDRWKFPITLTKRFIIETSGIIKELNIHAFQITDVKDVKQLSRYSSFCCFWLCLFCVTAYEVTIENLKNQQLSKFIKERVLKLDTIPLLAHCSISFLQLINLRIGSAIKWFFVSSSNRMNQYLKKETWMIIKYIHDALDCYLIVEKEQSATCINKNTVINRFISGINSLIYITTIFIC